MNAHRIARLGLIIAIVLSVCAPVSSQARRSSRSRTAGDPGGHTNRGVRYARKKQYDKAVEEFSKAIDAQPKIRKTIAIAGRSTG